MTLPWCGYNPHVDAKIIGWEFKEQQDFQSQSVFPKTPVKREDKASKLPVLTPVDITLTK